MDENIVRIFSRIQHKRGTAAEWTAANPILASAEIGVETDTLRFKIGDGVHAWKNLAYREFVLPAATATALGGIMAPERGTDDTVEVKIDGKTKRLYVPKYPVIPTLEAVAFSGEYGDLYNTPDPYVLPAAGASTLGGICAEPRTAAETQEVKIDQVSRRLYVAPTGGGTGDGDTGGGVDRTGILPGLQMRVIPRKEPGSTIFTNEDEAIADADIYFRPMCSLEEFEKCADNLNVALVRFNTRYRKKAATEYKLRQKSMHVVDTYGGGSSMTYPSKTVFTYKELETPVWTPKDIVPCNVKSLLQGTEYTGQWIKLPYSLEVIVRRFIYCYMKLNTTQVQIMPISVLKGDGTLSGARVKISGSRNRTLINQENVAHSRSRYYASVNLGLCFCREQGAANYVHWNMGPVTEFRALVYQPLYVSGMNVYHVQIGNSRKKVLV